MSAEATTDGAYRRWRRILADHRLPAAVVDLEVFDANARAILERAGGLPVRIASKSVRCTALLRRLRDSDSRFRGLMCFTAGEAAWLADRGFDDLLVAYPSTTHDDIAAACRATAAGARIVLTADSEAHLRLLSAIAADHGVKLPVSVEIDLSLRLPGLTFGALRSPLREPATVAAVARAAAADPHLEPAAIMGYEAQLAGVPDAAPGQWLQNRLVRLLKRISRHRIRQRREAILGALDAANLRPAIVNAGGTGSLEFSRGLAGVTEVTAGSGFYNPLLFDAYTGFRHRPAAGFALPVSRRPGPGMVTCLGGGYPASGAAGEDRLPRPWLPAGARLSPLEGAGEVQTPVFYDGPETLELGDPVLFRHAKAGELCERFDRLLLVEGEEIVDEVPTYRGEGQCFL